MGPAGMRYIALDDLHDEMRLGCPRCGWQGKAAACDTYAPDDLGWMGMLCPRCDRLLVGVDLTKPGAS